MMALQSEMSRLQEELEPPPKGTWKGRGRIMKALQKPAPPPPAAGGHAKQAHLPPKKVAAAKEMARQAIRPVQKRP